MKNNCIGCAYHVFDCVLGVKKECTKGYEYYFDEDWDDEDWEDDEDDFYDEGNNKIINLDFNDDDLPF